MSSRRGPSTRPYGRWRFPGGPDDCRFHRRALPAVSRLSQSLAKVEEQSAALKRPLALRDLVLTQLLYVVGSSWVGVAARLGESQSAFWLLAIVLFYLPQAAVVIYLTRRLPLEGGLYQWTKVGFGEFWGFLTAWNLWVYTLVLLAATSLAVSSTLAYAVGPRAAALAGTERFQLLVGVALIALMVTVAIFGLRIGKWVHNFGGLAQLLAFAALIVAPLVAAARGRARDLPSARRRRSHHLALQRQRIGQVRHGCAERIRVGGDHGRRIARSKSQHLAVRLRGHAHHRR